MGEFKGKSPNQRSVKITHTKTTSPFTIIPGEVSRYVIKNLSGSALKLWLYLNSNAEGYIVLMSVIIAESVGLSEYTLTVSFKELVSKGFLKPVRKYYYEFIDYPLGESKTEKITALDNSDEPEKSANPGKSRSQSHEKQDFKAEKKAEENNTIPDIRNNTIPDTGISISRETIQRIVSEFERAGFVYSGNGGGGLSGFIKKQLKKGYAENDLLLALRTMEKCNGGMQQINNHVGYFIKVLKSLEKDGKLESQKEQTDYKDDELFIFTHDELEPKEPSKYQKYYFAIFNKRKKYHDDQPFDHSKETMILLEKYEEEIEKSDNPEEKAWELYCLLKHGDGEKTEPDDLPD